MDEPLKRRLKKRLKQNEPPWWIAVDPSGEEWEYEYEPIILHGKWMPFEGESRYIRTTEKPADWTKTKKRRGRR